MTPPLTRNRLFLVALAVTVLILALQTARARRLEVGFERDFAAYQRGVNLLNQRHNQEALPILAELLDRQPTSYILHWYYGVALGGVGKIEESLEAYARAKQLNPFLVQNAQFAFQYGFRLYQTGKYAMAKTYLEESVKAGLQDDSQIQANLLLSDLAKRGL